jgi:hypothetical protein
MWSDRSVRIHLGPAVLEAARAGRHNFLNRLTGALREAGFAPEYRDNSFAERLRTGALPGWSLFEMEPPEGPQSLVFRRAYVGPFWQIDRTDRRWEWDVARADFDPAQVDAVEAARFAASWRRWLYGEKTAHAVRGGTIYVPLQSQLTVQRSFQASAPLAMLEMLLDRYPGRRIVATLHPKVALQPAETGALADLLARRPALRVDQHPAVEMLQRCDFVATQNSAVAFDALFFRKRAILFAGIDFHHPFASVWRDGSAAAFGRLDSAEPHYDAYLCWYLQRQSLNAGRPDFEARAIARLARLGMATP